MRPGDMYIIKIYLILDIIITFVTSILVKPLINIFWVHLYSYRIKTRVRSVSNNEFINNIFNR